MIHTSIQLLITLCFTLGILSCCMHQVQSQPGPTMYPVLLYQNQTVSSSMITFQQTISVVQQTSPRIVMLVVYCGQPVMTIQTPLWGSKQTYTSQGSVQRISAVFSAATDPSFSISIQSPTLPISSLPAQNVLLLNATLYVNSPYPTLAANATNTGSCHNIFITSTSASIVLSSTSTYAIQAILLTLFSTWMMFF